MSMNTSKIILCELYMTHAGASPDRIVYSAASLQGTGASVRRHSLPSLPCSNPLHSLGRRERVCMVYCL